MSKCEYQDKGYCKEKSSCTKNHPTNDCDGRCDDLKSCQSRHRKPCKNGESCVFHASQACEFLHEGIGPLHGAHIEQIQSDMRDIDTKVKTIDKIIERLELPITDQEKKGHYKRPRE